MQTASTTANRVFVNSIAFAVGNALAGDRQSAVDWIGIASREPVSRAAQYRACAFVGRTCRLNEARRTFRAYTYREQLAKDLAAHRAGRA